MNGLLSDSSDISIALSGHENKELCSFSKKNGGALLRSTVIKSRSYAALLRQSTTVKPEKKDADWPNRITGITVGINSSTTDLLKAPESVNKAINTTQIQLRERPCRAATV